MTGCQGCVLRSKVSLYQVSCRLKMNERPAAANGTYTHRFLLPLSSTNQRTEEFVGAKVHIETPPDVWRWIQWTEQVVTVEPGDGHHLQQDHGDDGRTRGVLLEELHHEGSALQHSSTVSRWCLPGSGVVCRSLT